MTYDITDDYQHYRFSDGLKKTEDFFYKRFTDIYIELAKGRLINAVGGDGSGASAAATLHQALSVLLRLFAPALPFITEEAWSWGLAEATETTSIHLADWPCDQDFDRLADIKNRDCFNTVAAVMHRINKLRTDRKLLYRDALDSVTISDYEFEQIEAVL